MPIERKAGRKGTDVGWLQRAGDARHIINCASSSIHGHTDGKRETDREMDGETEEQAT